jgi:hypothetical protein
VLQLDNNTPFAVNMAMYPNEAGVDTFYLIVKAGFNIGEKWTLIDEQIPPLTEDVYWGEPNQSSLKFASDYHLGKPATDIVMIGQACAPAGKPVKAIDVELTVGEVEKTVRVFGDRVWRDGQITAPKPFKAMPMVYEKAYGGVYITEDEQQFCEERNPVGCGFAGDRSIDDMNGLPLPNLEDPADLIRQHSDQPAPSCFAFSSSSWQPRANYVGTYDQSWQNQQAPYLPGDFDKRFFNSAHSDLIYPGFLRGREAVRISNMHADGEIQFNLPQVNLVSEVSIGNDTQSPSFNLETLLLEPNQLQLSMVWRASINCDKRLLKIKQARVALAG